MKKLLAWGERMGGIVRAPRLYFAAVPLAVPLLFATVDTTRSVVSHPPRGVEVTHAATFAPVHLLTPPPAKVVQPAPPQPAPPPAERSVDIPVRSGDTLDSIFRKAGLTAPEAYALVSEFSKTVDPRRLRLGDLIRFQYADQNAVTAVSMKVTGWGEVNARRGGEGFSVVATEAPSRVEETVVSATIESSLYDALRGAGEGPQLVQTLVDVFQWDVDFFALKKGDAFSLLVEKKYSGSDLVGYGPILAARFIHDGKTYEAFRFLQADGAPGYYTADGTPVKKQFLKAPLKFSRVTSGFTKKRFHPVLKVNRPHHGVDYGAPIGTPVMTTADGVVTFVGKGRGEGNFIRIRHNSRIETAYLHLSKFAKGLRKGSRVEQGDVIGYVGATGLASGPHLDYRVRDGGVWMNPLHLKSITPDPLRGEARRKFHAAVARNSEKLESSLTRLASNQEIRRALF